MGVPPIVVRNWWLMVGITTVSLGCGGATGDQHHAIDSGRSREIVITTVPLLTKELARVYPFLERDFAAGGVLSGKELYEFMPSTIAVNEGDTLKLTFINPEDDAHSFVMSDLSVAIPGQSVTHATYVARGAGIFDFVCAIPTHSPMMRGQLVVLRR